MITSHEETLIQVKKSIENLANSGVEDISPENVDMKCIKKHCKIGGLPVVTDVFRLLMTQLHREHSQVRLSTLLAMDQLFERSHNFRALLINSRIEFQKFLELILGVALCPPEDEDPVHADRTDAAGRKRSKLRTKKSEKKQKQGLPPPKVAAKKLTTLSLETLKKWQDKFGSGYPLLRSAYEYLVKDGLIDIPGRRIFNPEQVAANNKRKQFAAEQLKARMTRICIEYDDFIANDVQPIMDQVNSGVELLIPRDYLVETTITSSSLQNNSLTASSNTLCDRQEHALNNSNEISLTFGPNSMSVKKTNDTEDIIRCVQEQAKILVRCILPKLKKLMSRMSEGTEYSEAKLKSAIDMKSSILKKLSKLSQLGILKDDDRCHSGDKRSSTKVTKKKRCRQENRADGEEKDISDADMEQDDDADDDDDDEEEFIEVPEKPGLQSVIAQHERHLYGLETNSASSKDSEGTSKQFKSQGRTCRAPLPSGKLCPRQDAIKCPFHGLIIDRSSLGQPVNEADRIREEEERANRIPEWQDPQYLRDLEGQLGIDLTVGKRKKLKIASLSQLKSEKNSRQRIMEKIFTKSSQLRVASDLDAIESANQRQFEDNWSYAMNT